jgi:hypothetical protein
MQNDPRLVTSPRATKRLAFWYPSPARLFIRSCLNFVCLPSCFYLHTHLLATKSVGPAAVTLLSDGELDTLALGEGDPGLLLSDDDNVGLTSGELVVNGILQVDNVEATIVTLTVGDDTNTAHVATTGDHDDDTSVELDEVLDLASGKVNLDGVVDLDGGVGVTDATHVVSIYHKTSPDPGRMPGARGFPAQHLAQTWSNV